MIKKFCAICATVLILALLFVLLPGMTVQKDAIPFSAVELSRMNVFYMGMDCPIEIRVAGVELIAVEPRISVGKIRPDTVSGRYIVNVPAGMKTTITLVLKNDPTNVISTHEYRVKRVPDPITYIEHVRNDGVILKENLQNISGVFTRMENFDFECSFQPMSFSMSVIEDGKWKEYTATGPVITAEMKTALEKAQEEDKILFHNVITKGPDGTIRKVNAVLITVK